MIESASTEINPLKGKKKKNDTPVLNSLSTTP
jgi:hypothetical protein